MFLFFLQGMNTVGVATSGMGVATPFKGSAFFLNPATLSVEEKSLSLQFDYNTLKEKQFAIYDSSPQIFTGGLLLGFDEIEQWSAGGLISIFMKGVSLGLSGIFNREGILSFKSGFYYSLTQRLNFAGAFNLGPKMKFKSFQGGMTMNWERKLFLGVDGLYNGEQVFNLGGHLLYLVHSNIGLILGGNTSFTEKDQYKLSCGLQLNYKVMNLTTAYLRDFFLKTDLFSFNIGFSFQR